MWPWYDSFCCIQFSFAYCSQEVPEFRLFYIKVYTGYVYFIYISVRHAGQIFHVTSLVKCPGHKVYESQNVKIIEI